MPNLTPQEHHTEDAYRLLSCCILCSRTSGGDTVKNAVAAFFKACPTPTSVLSTDQEELRKTLLPLGLNRCLFSSIHLSVHLSHTRTHQHNLLPVRRRLASCTCFWYHATAVLFWLDLSFDLHNGSSGGDGHNAHALFRISEPPPSPPPRALFVGTLFARPATHSIPPPITLTEQGSDHETLRRRLPCVTVARPL